MIKVKTALTGAKGEVMICTSTIGNNAGFGIDPQTQDEPDYCYCYCEQCGARISVDDICEVPFDTSGEPLPWENYFKNCCIDCYDEVCDEEGFIPDES